jgi:OmcA/MtrC family decaheme c-type cytochrome
LYIQEKHAAKEGAPPTPDNPVVLTGLAVFQYGIDNVTVGSDNGATIKFWIKKGIGLDNGDLGPLTYVNLLAGSTDNTARAPSGFTGSPSFLIAHAGAAANPQDYSNWDEVANTGFGQSYATGQPKSVQIVQTVSSSGSVTKGLTVTSTDNQVFTTKLTGLNTFPGDAKMRAVGLQAYFTQTNLDISFPPDGVPDNVARHTPAVYFPVDKDAKRRVIVKSGYVDSADKLVDNPAVIANLKPIGCLECHEAFEGHGGNRVNNVQVCVMCHNPQLTTSGRTIPDNVTISTNVTSHFPAGTSPLQYPEVTQSMGSMIHGLHGGLGADPAASSSTAAGLRQQNIRVNNFQIVRNRQETPGVYGVYIDSAEVTYPGDLTHCTKCHYAANPPAQTPVPATTQSYKADLPTGVLFGTEKVTTGNSSETLTQIIGARQSFQGHDPSGNPTDLVDSPLVGKCGYCHDTPAAIGHFLSTGGADIKATRSTAQQTPPPLAPDVTP